MKRSDIKHLYVSKEVWKRVHELKYEWGKRSFGDVVEELLKRLGLWESSDSSQKR